MENDLELIFIQLGQFKLSTGRKSFFQTGINALSAINAPSQVKNGFVTLLIDLIDGNGIGRTIPHTHLASDAFGRIKGDLASKPLGHTGLVCRVIQGGWLLE
jgi:hypothetical protein